MLSGFLTFWKVQKSKMSETRWRLTGCHDVNVTRHDVTNPTLLMSKEKDVFIPFKFSCHGFNILEVTERVEFYLKAAVYENKS